MNRALMGIAVVAVLVVTLGHGSALAQDQEYALKDYMPQTAGSKWIMTTAGQQGAVTVTYEVDKARDLGGQQAMPIVMKNAQGNVRRGSLESVTEANLTLFGAIMVPRGQEGGAPVEMLYTPPAVFPGKLKVGQSAQAVVKVQRGDQPVEMTLKVVLAAVESVTVPKGAFADCLRIVFSNTTPRGEMKRTIWYAKGVGMVRTENPGFGNQPTPRVGELTDYQLAP
jgi:hypothetical protein